MCNCKSVISKIKKKKRRKKKRKETNLDAKDHPSGQVGSTLVTMIEVDY